MTVVLLQSPHTAGAAAWTVEREWTMEEERAFSQWFEKLASKSWKSTNAMLKNPEFNSLYEDGDKQLDFYADCGDLPYVIRAYYSWKRRLPYVGNQVQARRYGAEPNTTTATFDNLSHDGTLQRFLQLCSWNTHSGNFRTAPEAQDSFTYPIAITRQALRPGAVFYSPNGHVAMVAEVRDDGTIKLVDAHPDQSVTRISFGPKLEWRSRTYSGGFRWFRTAVVRDGRAVFESDNTALPGFSMEQYDLKDYYAALQERLTRTKINPLLALETYIREDSYQEALDRVEAVNAGWEVGRRRAIALGANIYDDTGDWENFSTPSRDLRLRLSFLHIPELIRGYVAMMRQSPEDLDTEFASPEALGEALLALKDRLFQELTFQYTNSDGSPVELTMADLEERLFDLSFDPNHAPELRWGARGDELKTAARDSSRHYAGYDEQKLWRNRLVKKQGRMGPDDEDNPRVAPEHNLSAMIALAVREETGIAPYVFVGPPAPSGEARASVVVADAELDLMEAADGRSEPAKPAEKKAARAPEDQRTGEPAKADRREEPAAERPATAAEATDSVVLLRKRWDELAARRNVALMEE